jgi:uncharacterized protein (DUF427 family)
VNQQAQPATRTIKVPGPDHPIEIAPNPSRVVVTLGGRTVADSKRSFTLREANYPAVHYIPRGDVNMALLTRSAHTTYCPYKGECNYFSITADGKLAENAVWTYESPYAAVAQIKDHLAFYPDRVDSIEEMS